MNPETQLRSTSALATHCYAILMTAMPAVRELAITHGVLLTEDALNFIEDTAATCLIQSAITIARARGYAEQGIDFATVDAIEAGKVFVELAQCPEFRARMVRAGRAEEEGEMPEEAVGAWPASGGEGREDEDEDEGRGRRGEEDEDEGDWEGGAGL